MRKISTFCRYEQIFCRAIIACSLFATNGHLGWAAEIAPPESPAAQPPPPLVPGQSWEDGQREKRSHRQETESQAQDALATQKVVEMKSKENSKIREYYGFSDLNFYLAKASVSDHRSHYSADPGVQFSTYIRSFWNSKPFDLQPWYGLRVAPFGGYGTQNSLTARYAHTWIGPGIGIGRFGPPDDPRENGGASYFTLLSAGLAGVSRLANPKDAPTSAPEDFRSTPWANDAMGAWAEFRWSQISLGALGLGATVGIQTGSGKVFSYAGATCSAYY